MKTFLSIVFLPMIALSQTETASPTLRFVDESQNKKILEQIDKTDLKGRIDLKTIINGKNDKDPNKDKFKINEDLKKKLLKQFRGTDSGGGWGSSGGGSGVACFPSTEIAMEADSYISKSKPLPTELKDKMVSLETLEHWEYRQTDSFPLIKPEDKDFTQIVAQVKYNMSFIAPLYIFRLNKVSELMPTESWIGKDYVPRIYDTKPSSPIPTHCRQIQLVARFAKENYKVGHGPSGKLPVVKLEADEDLFSRLDPLNQAMLILHEEMYMLGQMLGHRNSDEIRNLVITFFNENFQTHRPVNTRLDYKMRRVLVRTFGDYVLFFGDDHIVTGQAGTQESRFASFNTMLKKLRAQVGACPKTVKGYNPQCRDEAMDPERNQNWFTDEMSYLFIGYYFLDISQQKMNAEFLIAPVADELLKDIALSNVVNTCRWIHMNQYQLRFKLLTEKALNYCELVMPTRHVSPKETDQN